MDATGEAMEKISIAHAKGGVTSIVSTTKLIDKGVTYETF